MSPARFARTLYLVVSIYGAIRVAKHHVPGLEHWGTFAAGGRALLESATAYGIRWGDNPYYYSPTCGIAFFGPLALLPDPWGLAIYLAASWLVFTGGLWICEQRFLSRPSSLRRAALWASITPTMLSALVAHKLELMSAGVTLLGLAALLTPASSGRLVATAVAAAAMTQFKLQPLPTFGLVVVGLGFRDAALRRWLAAFCVALALWTLLPFVWNGPTYAISAYRDWLTHLGAHSADGFDFFDNGFAFVWNNLGLKMSYGTAQAITLATGLALAAGFGLNRPADKRAALLAAGTLGAAFTVLFSPLQQINAYVLVAPIYLAMVAVAKTRKQIVVATLLWAVITLGYSELVPLAVRETIRHTAHRPIACAVLAALCSYWLYRLNGRRAAR